MSLWDKAWPGPAIRYGKPLGATPLGADGKVPPEFWPPEIMEGIAAGTAAVAAADAAVEAATTAASAAIVAADAGAAAEAAANAAARGYLSFSLKADMEAYTGAEANQTAVVRNDSTANNGNYHWSVVGSAWVYDGPDILNDDAQLAPGLYGVDDNENIIFMLSGDGYFCPPISEAIAEVAGGLTTLAESTGSTLAAFDAQIEELEERITEEVIVSYGYLAPGLYVVDGDENIVNFLSATNPDDNFPPPGEGGDGGGGGGTNENLFERDGIPPGFYVVDGNENIVSYTSSIDPAQDFPQPSDGVDEDLELLKGNRAFNLGLRAEVNLGLSFGESKADFVSTGHTVFADLYELENDVVLAAAGLEVPSSYSEHNGAKMSRLLDEDLTTEDHDDIDGHVAAALTAGKSFAISHVGLMMGYNDMLSNTPAAEFKSLAYQLMDERSAYIAQATGIKESPVWIMPLDCCFLKAGHPDAYLIKTVLEMAKERDNLVISCATYQFAFADGIHMSQAGAKTLSAYNFIAHKRWSIDGVKFHPTAYEAGSGFVQNIVISSNQRSIWTGRFTAPVLPLAFDTDTVTNLADGHFGFRAFDNLGQQLEITSVKIVGQDIVQIMAETLTGSGSNGRIVKIDYAMAADEDAEEAELSGNVTGARGCLCDSTTTEFTTGDTTTVLKSFCIPFTFTL